MRLIFALAFVAFVVDAAAALKCRKGVSVVISQGNMALESFEEVDCGEGRQCMSGEGFLTRDNSTMRIVEVGDCMSACESLIRCSSLVDAVVGVQGVLLSLHQQIAFEAVNCSMSCCSSDLCNRRDVTEEGEEIREEELPRTSEPEDGAIRDTTEAQRIDGDEKEEANSKAESSGVGISGTSTPKAQDATFEPRTTTAPDNSAAKPTVLLMVLIILGIQALVINV